MANLYDVARRANVSKTLVSRVINGQKGVSPASTERILAAMRELNYTPNKLARALVLGKTSTIGVVLDSLCEPFTFGLIRGIEFEAEKRGYHVIFCSGHNNSTAKEQYIDLFSTGSTDGVIIYGSDYGDDDLLLRRSRSDFPIVVVENEMPPGQINNITLANAEGSAVAAQHLLECGCRRVLHVAGPSHNKVSQDRWNGFRDCADRIGLCAEMVQCDAFTVNSGYVAVRHFLQTLKDSPLPDAIYFGGDVLAYGGMIYLKEQGIRVPQDLKIMGFDDEPACNYGISQELTPLTTLRQPLFDMGCEAVSLLLQQIAAPQMACRRTVFQPELVVRASTGK